MHKEKISSQSQSHALILGKALSIFYPSAQRLSYSVDGSHFCYEILLDQNQPVHLEEVERKMNDLISLKEDFYPLEMIFGAAHELFMHHGQETKASSLSEENLHAIVKIGDYFDTVENDTPQMPEGEFKLVKHEESVEEIDGFDKTLTRIYGVWASDKSELKQELKNIREQEKFCHIQMGKVNNLFLVEPSAVMVLPKGQRALEHLQKNLETLLESEGFEKISSLGQRPNIGSLKKTSLEKVFWQSSGFTLSPNPHSKGLYRIEEGSQNLFILRAPVEDLEKESIYCLKFYLKIIKILGFSYEVSSFAKKDASWMKKLLDLCEIESSIKESKSNKIELDLKDHWGRTAATGSLKIKEKNKEIWIEGALPANERLLGALLEDHLGALPHVLCSTDLGKREEVRA